VIQQGNSFPKSYRVLLKKDFSYLRDQSHKDFESPLIFYSKKSRLDLPHMRLGLSVSSKQGNSVRRNRIKRLLREQFRKNPLRNSVNLDVLVTTAHKIQDESQLIASFNSLIKKLSARK